MKVMERVIKEEKVMKKKELKKKEEIKRANRGPDTTALYFPLFYTP